MAVVRLVLRDKDNVGLFNLRQMTDRTRNDSLSDGEPFRVYNGTADEPRVNQDAERAVC